MKAKWVGTCSKCGVAWYVGDDIKPWYVFRGIDHDGKRVYQRQPKKYVHAPSCPPVTPNRPGQRQVDMVTGEILEGPPRTDVPVGDSAPTLFDQEPSV